MMLVVHMHFALDYTQKKKTRQKGEKEKAY
jgi:hypothetical protein